jgi:hypothetical protein
LFFPNVFWFWWNAIGAAVTVSVGVMLGLLLPDPRQTRNPAVEPLARAFPLRESVLMLIAFICILVFCVLLPRNASAAAHVLLCTN